MGVLFFSTCHSILSACSAAILLSSYIPSRRQYCAMENSSWAYCVLSCASSNFRKCSVPLLDGASFAWAYMLCTMQKRRIAPTNISHCLFRTIFSLLRVSQSILLSLYTNHCPLLFLSLLAMLYHGRLFSCNSKAGAILLLLCRECQPEEVVRR